MKKLVLLILTALTLSLYAGIENYAIVVPGDAIPAEKNAALELQKYIQQMSGKKIALVPYGKLGNRNAFYIGQSGLVAKKSGMKSFGSLKPDEIILRRIGNDFIFTGDRPRGTLYAVYTFLEDFCNVKFFAPEEIVVPKSLQLPDKLDIRYAPDFIVRETPFATLRLNSEFAAQSKVNGHWQKTTKKWGGHETILGFCHTFAKLLPPGKYAEKHPEWYSEINGVRRPVGNQLCLSNPEMRREIIKNIRKLLLKNPETKIISISQDDNNSYCHCKKCSELVKRFGNVQSGAIIDFVNEIAAALEKEFPKVYFETLAYSYSIDAPKNIRPRHNVTVRLCSTGDFGRPMNSPANAKFRDALIAWSKLTDKLMVWHYVSLFYNALIPNPNWENHAADLRFFRNHNVIAVFNQASGGHLSDFAPLRAYLNSKLLWNPNLDQKKIIREFLVGYYGNSSAPYLSKYLDIMKINYKKQPNFKLKWATPTSEWLTYTDMEKARHLMGKALQAAKGKYIERVRKAKLAIDLAFLLHPDTPQHYVNKPEIPAKILDEVLELTGKYKLKYYGEGRAFPPLAKSLRSLYLLQAKNNVSLLPEFCKKLPEGNVIVVPNADLTAYENKIRTFREKDKNASSGTAIRMRTDHKSWLIQFNTLSMRAKYQGRWKVYARLRIVPAGRVQLGLYDAAHKKNTSKFFNIGNSYTYFHLGTFDASTTKPYFFCAPSGDIKSKNIYFDHLILVKELNKSHLSK